MEVTGTIVSIGEVQKGTGANGEWSKQLIIIETEGQYPKKICLTCFGKIIDSTDTLYEGVKINASINLESREHDGRWYTEVKMWKFLINN